MIQENKIAPSLLAADFANIERDIKMLETAGADVLHIDVMDGHFVPNLSIGLPLLKAIKRVSSIPCDVHLMIQNPGRYIDDFVAAGADILTIHAEATQHIHGVIQQIKKKGIKVGVALNPGTPLFVLDEILPDIDLVLIMSVNPGFGGQSFIPNTLDKISRLREILDESNLEHIIIEVDGGIKIDNIEAVANAGANLLVSGSGIMNAENPSGQLQAMKNLINK